MWAPYLEWSLENPDYSGNPFDIGASATFTHSGSGQQITTGLFYAGDNIWKLRFSGVRIGTWTVSTASDEAALDGHSAVVTIFPNPNPQANGFISSAGNKFARQTGEQGELKAYLFNVFQDDLEFPSNRWDFVNDRSLDYIRTYPAEQWATEYLQKAHQHGSNTLFISLAHQWLQVGALTYDDHDSENPDFLTFDMLERVITTVHDQGGHLHIWVWGDEDRRATPIGLPGGINGEVDRRLQRYIAARLGPLPGWTMGYGFDLFEWVTPAQVEAWRDYMHDHFGWPHLLMAREESSFLTPDSMDVNSVDDRLNDQFYANASDRLAETPRRPIQYERRFYAGRDNVWTMEATRRAMWQFVLAGGAGSHWGIHRSLSDPEYSNPEQMEAYRLFWQARFLLDMLPANELTDGYALKSESTGCYVFYKEDTSSIQMNLSGMVGPQPAVAVDTRLAYAEIDLGILAPTNHTWNTPYQSDWAIAVGDFDRQATVASDFQAEPLDLPNNSYLPLITRGIAADRCGY